MGHSNAARDKIRGHLHAVTNVQYLGVVASIYGYPDVRENRNQSLEFFRNHFSNRQTARQPWTLNFQSADHPPILFSPHGQSVRI